MKTKIDIQDIEDQIDKVEFTKFTDRMTLAQVTMKNGYQILGMSACVDPANYNQELGEKYAKEDAIQQLWPLLGYELRSKLSVQEGSWLDRAVAEAKELDAKIQKLLSFQTTDQFAALPEEDRLDLESQARGMDIYFSALVRRLRRAGANI